MQLAAPQRAHPPPVPPRPSRQVVAEALKKSPRPPCPTRQAPPPPNQRPWRLEEQQRPRESLGGTRTIVYDSAHVAKPGCGINAKAKVQADEHPHQRLGAEEKRRPSPRDLNKVPPQAVTRTSNGTSDLRRQSLAEEVPKRRPESEDSLKKLKNNSDNVERDRIVERSVPNVKSTKNEKNVKNAHNMQNGHDEEDGVRVEVKENNETDAGSTERRRKKLHNVSFKEEKEEIVEPVLADLENKKVPEVRATVVVIEEAEGPRITSQEEHDNIQRQDWLEAGVRYSSTKITLPGEEVVVVNGFAKQDQDHQQQQQQQQQQEHERQREIEEEEESDEVEGVVENQLEFGDLDFSSIIERIAMSSLQGLPPLPRSLSGFNLNGAGLIGEPPPPPPARSSSRPQRMPKTPTSTTSSQGSRPSPQGRQLTTLDTQLAILRREMFGLRQLDLSLLSQLWSLNESIQEFRQLLQEQEDRAPSPSPSSEEGDDTSYGGSSQPPPPPRRPAPTTPHHHQQQQHHHKYSRSLRNSKLSPSDESPSSEEYGAL